MIKYISVFLIFFSYGTLSAIEFTSSEAEYSTIDKGVNNKDLAELWGLSESDIKNYQMIMMGPRGNFSPGIAPPLALALESNDINKQYKYLTIYAHLEYQRTQRDLIVSRLYDKIFSELYPEPAINKNILFENQQEYIKPGDRFVIFVDGECDTCKSRVLNDLIKTSGFPNNQTDIYVKGLERESDLHSWASANSIKVKDVQDGHVTLNLMQSNTLQFLDKTDYVAYVLRNESLFSFFK